MRLANKIAVVTGAAQGIGLATALKFAREGASVVVCDVHDVAEAAAAVGAASVEGAACIGQVVDVTDRVQVDAMVAATLARFGRIDVLVNNAGVGRAVPTSREKPEAFADTLQVNLSGPFHMAQACAPHMPPGSAIVNVASVLGHIAPRFPQAAYAASKAGLLGLTRNLAQEWSGRKGIRVNALCPGYFASEMTADGDQQLRDMVAEHSMLGRFGEQAELDTALIFLASPASSYVTGTSLLVDGGMAAL